MNGNAARARVLAEPHQMYPFACQRNATYGMGPALSHVLSIAGLFSILQDSDEVLHDHTACNIASKNVMWRFVIGIAGKECM
jgi:hypothetical protein